MPKLQLLARVGICVALWSAPAAAEDLLQVYQQALGSAPALKAAAANREAAREAQPQVRALSLPNVGITLEQARTFDLAGVPQVSAYNSHSYVVGLQQPLYNRSHQVRQRLAEVAVGQAELAFLSAEDEIIPQVAQAYFGALAALDTLGFTTAEKNAFARQLEQVNRRFEVGLATITDVYDAQARFDSAVSQEIDALNNLANAREALYQLTGQDYVRLRALSEQMPLALPEPPDPEVWVRQALEQNLRLRSARLGVEQARENIQLQQAGHYPTVNLNASRANTGRLGSETSGSQIGVQVNIPLYSGGAVSSRTREAAYQYEASRQNLETLQRQIVRVVRDAYRGQETAISQISALHQTRISTRSALEATQAGYEVGTRTIVDVLDAERNVFRAERDYAAARYQYVLNYLILRQAAAPLTEADLTRINAWLQDSVSLPGKATAAPASTVSTAASTVPPSPSPPSETGPLSLLPGLQGPMAPPPAPPAPAWNAEAGSPSPPTWKTDAAPPSAVSTWKTNPTPQESTPDAVLWPRHDAQ